MPTLHGRLSQNALASFWAVLRDRPTLDNQEAKNRNLRWTNEARLDNGVGPHPATHKYISILLT